MSSALVGVAFAVAAAVAFSTASVFIKVSLADIRSPPLINGLRAAFASIPYVPLLLLTGIKPPNTASAIVLLVASALIGPGLGDVSFIASIDRLGAGPATVLAYQYILIAQALSVAVLHDYRGLIAIYLTPVALLGMYLMVSEEGFKASARGITLAYVAAVAWALSTIMISELVNKYSLPPQEVAGFRVWILAPVLTALGLSSGNVGKVTKKAVVVLASSGIISYFAGFVLFTASLKALGVMIPSLASALSPMLTQVMTVKILGEKLTLRKAIGSLLIVASLAVTALYVS